MRPMADVIYTAGGAPIAYTVTANDFTRENERPTIGTATAQDAGSVGSTIGWARWAGGTTGGSFFSDTDGMPLGANEGFHIVAGDPANLKLTWPGDFALAEQLLAARSSARNEAPPDRKVRAA